MQAQKTLASAIQIGNPVSFEKAIRTLKQFNGIVEQATEEELADAAALGDRTGMFNCPHTGVALAVLIKLLKAGKIDKSERVVVISTAHGLKFVEMKVKYHQRELEFPSRHANQPIELPARLDAVKDALHQALKKRRTIECLRNRPIARKLEARPPSAIHGLGRVAARPTSPSPRRSSRPRTISFDTTAEVFEFMKAKGEGQIIREHEYGRYGNPTQQECRTQARRHRGRRARHPLLHRHERRHPDAHDLHEAGRPHHLHQRLLPPDARLRHQPARRSSASRSPWWTRPPRPSRRPSGPTRTSSSPSRPRIPTCACSTSPAVVKVAKKHKVLTIIDATLATPYNISPLELGVDIVIHSATKYLGGHNDLLAGVTLGTHKLLNDLNRMQRMIGATPGPLHLLPAGARPQDLRPADGTPQPRGPGRRAHAGGASRRSRRSGTPGLKSHPDHAHRRRRRCAASAA